MGACKDPALTYLNKAGYNVVKLPRAGIEPLDVLGRDRSLERLGTISEVWTSTKPVPSPKPPAPAAGVTGKKSANLDLGVGLKLLANALSGMGSAIGLPSLGLAYKRARSVEFEFLNVTAVVVDPFAIGDYLSAGTLDLANPFVQRYFGNDETDEYIISEVLKSDSVTVTAKSEDGTEVKLDIPALQSLLGANVKLAAGGASEGQFVYSGKIPVTFGFKLYQVYYENGKWGVRGTKPDGNLAFAVPGAGGGNEPIVLGADRMVRVR